MFHLNDMYSYLYLFTGIWLQTGLGDGNLRASCLASTGDLGSFGWRPVMGSTADP